MAGFTQEQYDALCAAIATGTKAVKYADKEVQYQSTAQMLEVKNLMEEDLGISPTPTDYKRGRRIGDFYKN